MFRGKSCSTGTCSEGSPVLPERVQREVLFYRNVFRGKSCSTGTCSEGSPVLPERVQREVLLYRNVFRGKSCCTGTCSEGSPVVPEHVQREVLFYRNVFRGMLEYTLPSRILGYILYPQEYLTEDTLPTGMLEHNNNYYLPTWVLSIYFGLKNAGGMLWPHRHTKRWRIHHYHQEC